MKPRSGAFGARRGSDGDARGLRRRGFRGVWNASAHRGENIQSIGFVRQKNRSYRRNRALPHRRRMTQMSSGFGFDCQRHSGGHGSGHIRR